ncbi:hypothetical protein [Streptomyces termitum]|uniref:hypothetical protein n=1 Tax=Streptomyces termitum TaxID=67368 RepID=UPI003796188F
MGWELLQWIEQASAYAHTGRYGKAEEEIHTASRELPVRIADFLAKLIERRQGRSAGDPDFTLANLGKGQLSQVATLSRFLSDEGNRIVQMCRMGEIEEARQKMNQASSKVNTILRVLLESHPWRSPH